MSGIYHEWNGTVLTITSDSGTSSADLKGDKGDTGIRGAQGVAGKDADSGFATVKSVNDKTGEVVLTAEDVGALPADTVIPSTTGLATETYVDEKIAAIPKTDLTNYPTKDDLSVYATKAYVDSKIHYSPTQPTDWQDGDIWLQPAQ